MKILKLTKCLFKNLTMHLSNLSEFKPSKLVLQMVPWATWLDSKTKHIFQNIFYNKIANRKSSPIFLICLLKYYKRSGSKLFQLAMQLPELCKFPIFHPFQLHVLRKLYIFQGI